MGIELAGSRRGGVVEVSCIISSHFHWRRIPGIPPFVRYKQVASTRKRQAQSQATTSDNFEEDFIYNLSSHEKMVSTVNYFSQSTINNTIKDPDRISQSSLHLRAQRIHWKHTKPK
jgi:phosphoribosyl 1,2-cyclic phosphodiesterase